MLEPPPVSRESLDRGALESEGKNRYLTALGKYESFHINAE